jgi:hypothetical protein
VPKNFTSFSGQNNAKCPGNEYLPVLAMHYVGAIIDITHGSAPN